LSPGGLVDLRRYEYALALSALEQKKGALADSSNHSTPDETGISRRNGARRVPAQPIAATGGNLVKRIRRLLYPQTRTVALTPFFAAAILIATAAAALAAWQAEPSRPAQEQANRESRFIKWLNEDVIYLINDAERAAFQRLITDEEREKFIEQFWLRRDPTPGTPENELKAEHYRRIAYANQRWAGSIPGWRTDRGRIYIRYGMPDQIESRPTGGPGHFPPSERWLYHHIEGIGDEVEVEFVDRTGNGDFQISHPKSM
jgi:GWxTD domain-containing protein